MLGLVVSHLVLACLLPLVSARSRRAGFAVAALPPAVALVWALMHAPEALTGVGAAIAAGNHGWNGSCADLVRAPSRIRTSAAVTIAPDGGAATICEIR